MMYKKPLSYSGKSLYKKCPAAFKSAYIDGVREEAGGAAERGTMLHTSLEQFFLGSPYPEIEPLTKWRRFMEPLTLKNPSVEGEVAVMSDWTPTSFDNPEAELRGAFDLSYSANGVTEIYDWKSGRVYDTHKAQGEHYVAMLPEADLYNVYFVYLDQYDTVHRYTYTQEQRKELQERISEEIKVIRADTSFIATPSQDACQWCKLSWRKGGACKEAP